MRKPILLLLPLVAACGDSDRADPAIIDRFLTHATPLVCEPVDLGIDVAAAEIRLTSDSTWTLLDGPQFQLLSFTDDFRLLQRTPLTDQGPGAAPHPVSAAMLGDSAVAVAARGGLRLVILSPDGSHRHSVPLEFIPNSVAATAAGDVLVTPVPVGSNPGTLLLRHTGSDWEPLPVPPRSYVDMSINALGNSTLVELFPDGRALVMHQFLSPRAFIVEEDGRVAERAAPTPDGTRENIDFIPRSPITDDQLDRTLVPAMAMTIDPLRSEVYIMTRSGARAKGLDRPERAILRLSDRLEFIEGYTLPVAAGSMVYLPRRHAALVVDEHDEFRVCSMPTADGA